MVRNTSRSKSKKEPPKGRQPEPEVLEAPAFTDEERRAVVDFMLALRKSHIQDFLKSIDLPKSGSKSKLREQIQDALDDGRLTAAQLVAFLDTVVPWGKQHVFLFTGPRGDVGSWKDPQHVLDKLKKQQLEHLFNARLPLVLPEKLTLSSITHAAGKLRVTAVQKREYTERAPEHDDTKETDGDGEVILKAYVHHVSRTLVAFEWDLNANAAMLQITQLNRDTLYEEVAKEFYKLVSGWLDSTMFAPVNVRAAIRKLHEMADNGHAEARFHGIDYRTLRGSRLSAKSPSARDSVFADDVIDGAMAGVATECDHLAKQNPDLAATIRRIDGQFEKMGTAEVVRADDLASFLRLDPNQVLSVLDMLADVGVLLREDMIECAHCDMAAPRADYEEAMEEDDEYRCTSCDRVLSKSTIRGIVTFRRGEKWPAAADDDGVGGATWMTVTAAAKRLMDVVSGLTLEKARARVSAAAGRDEFQTNGKERTDRRIDRDTFSTWLLKQRERDLAEADSDGW